MKRFKGPFSIAGSLAAAVATTATAEFNDAVVVRYAVDAVQFDGTTISVMVEDLYLLTDDPNDVDVNIYNVNIPAEARISYYQADAASTWTPGNLGGAFDTDAVRRADSFVTIGGFGTGTGPLQQSPGAGEGSVVDPFFGGPDADYPVADAGWFNSSPPNLNGLAGQTPAGLGVFLGRFAATTPFSLVGTTLEATWNQGLGTMGFQAAFTVREFIDCNGNTIEDMVEIMEGSVAPSPGAVQWSVAEGGNGHWYEVVGDDPSTWNEAAIKAASRGGYLATFAAAGEKAFLVGTTRPAPAVYVGGAQRIPAVEPLGSWAWTTEEPWSGVDWKKGEPNDNATFGGAERYLQLYINKINFGTFNDSAGEIPGGYVIEWDAPSDCNGNGALDTCDLASGLDTDLNGNRIPDGCEALEVPGAFATIQAAIDAAPDGGLVLVAPGTYPENLRFPVDGREIVLASTDGAESTIVDGSAESRAVLEIYGGQTAISRVTGLTFTGGRVGSLTPIAIPGSTPSVLAGGGVYIERSGVLFFDCVFDSNRSTFGGNFYGREFTGEIRGSRFVDGFAFTDAAGLQLFESDAVVTTSEFVGGSAGNHGGGVKVVNGFVDMIDCEIRNNGGNDGGGVYYFQTSGTKTSFNFLRCVVTGNVAKFDGGGFFSRPTESGPSLAETIVCDNLRDNFFGPFIDLGGNTLCICIGDLNRDGEVSGADLGLWLLEAGEECPSNGFCPADFNRDGFIDGADLGLLLIGWGPC